MTPTEFAELLAGATYRNVITKEQAELAKQHGLVVVYGQSDDLIEFRGAIHDEAGAYDGATAYVDGKGLLRERADIEDDDELKDYFARQPHAKPIEALWCDEDGYSWTYGTDIPHATFEVTEDGEPYCRGIVFALADVKAPA